MDAFSDLSDAYRELSRLMPDDSAVIFILFVFAGVFALFALIPAALLAKRGEKSFGAYYLGWFFLLPITALLDTLANLLIHALVFQNGYLRLLVILLLSLIPANIAKNKEFSFWGHYFSSIFFGFVPVLVYTFFLPTPAPSTIGTSRPVSATHTSAPSASGTPEYDLIPLVEPNEDGTITCPDCKLTQPGHRYICFSCQRPFVKKTPHTPQPFVRCTPVNSTPAENSISLSEKRAAQGLRQLVAPNADGTITCPKCEKTQPQNRHLCFFCNHPFVEKLTEETETQNTKTAL